MIRRFLLLDAVSAIFANNFAANVFVDAADYTVWQRDLVAVAADR